MKSLMAIFLLAGNVGYAAQSGLVCVAAENESYQAGFAKAAKAFNDKAASQATEQPCVFNGVLIPHSFSIMAYFDKNKSAGATTRCLSEMRNCNNGTLSGTYAYSSSACSGVDHAYVLFSDGKNNLQNKKYCVKIEDGDVRESLLKASKTALSRNKGKPCEVKGEAVWSGRNWLAYEKAEVGSGEDCKAELRSCVDGAMNGTYTFSSCKRGTAEGSSKTPALR